MASNYQPAPSDMVQQVQSIIQSYGDNGPIRALAQEPVQNSLDAKHDSPIVRVEYRLRELDSRHGETRHLLTVTDSGTYGLRGPALSQAELSERGYELETDENWAAFEGQGFTKKSDDSARGSRGQGKSAFLYHSSPPAAPGRRRMMMLYDTRLADGLYRLGVRNANPVDTIQSPPWLNAEAEELVSGQFTDETGIEIDLGLEPLTKVGTRVVVPYLSEEAVTAVKNGELVQWLRRCWWRAIQTGALEIRVIDEEIGHEETVAVPSWWQDEPWIGAKPEGVEVRSTANVDLGDGLRIKRIVLLYDEELGSTDVEGDDAQSEGVQLLRGQQWITTVGSGDRELSGFIPPGKRPGFRGFVEFDQSLEKELRNLESPQHHKFDRKQGLVQAIYRQVESAVEAFAKNLGWMQEPERPRKPAPQTDIAREILQWFGTDGKQPTESWNCSLSLSFPDPTVARVDWGQILENIRVHVTSSSSYPANVTVSLEAQHVDDSVRVSVRTDEVISFYDREGELKVGNFQIVRNAARPDQLQLDLQGKWKLTARVRHDGRQVARASRSIYVHQDPQNPERDPLTLSISVENQTRSVSGRERINYGEKVAAQINAHNNTPKVMNVALNASLAEATPMLADGESRSLRGTPEGDTSDQQAVWMGDIIFVARDTLPLADENAIAIPVEPGRHRLNADLFNTDGSLDPASASYILHIEMDPPNQGGLPFRLDQQPDERLPRWQLKEIDGETVLQFPERYATNRELMEADAANGTERRNSFLLEITCEALIQWALEPAWKDHDRTRLDDLCASEPRGVDSEKWERFVEMMELLEGAGGNQSEVPYIDFVEDFRNCAAHMMRMYEESH